MITDEELLASFDNNVANTLEIFGINCAPIRQFLKDFIEYKKKAHKDDEELIQYLMTKTSELEYRIERPQNINIKLENNREYADNVSWTIPNNRLNNWKVDWKSTK